jgi:hypothetical protein
MSDRVYFDPSGIDWDDDESIRRWAEAVWMHMTKERGESNE